MSIAIHKKNLYKNMHRLKWTNHKTLAVLWTNRVFLKEDCTFLIKKIISILLSTAGRYHENSPSKIQLKMQGKNIKSIYQMHTWPNKKGNLQKSKEQRRNWKLGDKQTGPALKNF